MPSTPIPAGKLPSDLLARMLAELPPLPSEVRVGPAVGEDACALDIPAGVLVAATDPITLTGDQVGRFAVMVNANDVAVMGVQPRWFLATILLPLGTTRAGVDALFTSMREALTEVGAVLVGGHTEVTGAVNQPVVVGQMLGLAEPDGRVLATAGARAGHAVVQVGEAPVEGAAVLAAELPDRLSGVASDVVRAAAAAIDNPGISVVAPALAAAALGATAMHDPTEGGLAAGLHELAAAAGAAVRVDTANVMWFTAGVSVCEALGADPWATLASGTLLATFRPGDEPRAVAELTARGYPAACIGVLEPGYGVIDLEGSSIALPARDEVARLAATADRSP